MKGYSYPAKEFGTFGDEDGEENMTEIMCMLANDHRNMTKILDALQRQISSLDHASSPNHHLIRSILEYILDYPTQVHHPVEDLVYGEMKIRNPAIARTLDGIEQEHADLEKQTRRFAVAVDRVLKGEKLPRQELARIGRDLTDRLQRHLATEETTLFPAARSSLMSSDWADIALVLGAPDDPLFGPRLRDFYRRLHKEIMASETAWADQPGHPVHDVPVVTPPLA
jgi:hemerythrin-like domain-containing protein